MFLRSVVPVNEKLLIPYYNQNGM
jgi:hypothetical protein